MAQLEIKKMKQGMSYSCKEKTIILNVFKYFRLHFPDKCVTEIVRRTAKATGCSEKSIFQFRKEESSVEGFRAPSTTKIRRNININSRDMKYDATVRQAIRNIIYDLKYKSIVPSLNTILKQINGDHLLPNFSLMTLRRLLFDMGFSYEKNGKKSILVEKPLVKKEPQVKKEKKAVPKMQVPLNEPDIKVNQQLPPQIQHPIVVQPQIQQQVNIPNPMPIENGVQRFNHFPSNHINEMLLPLPEHPPQPPPLPPPPQMHPPPPPQMHPPPPQMHPPTHNMMLSHHPHHGIPPHPPGTHPQIPPSMNMHIKHDMGPWMHPSHHHFNHHSMMKRD